LFLDDLLQQLQRQARLQDSSPALSYPYQDVLACVDVLFVSGSGGRSSSSSSGSKGAWHAKLAVLLYYLLDGGWLGSAEPFAQVGMSRLLLCSAARGRDDPVLIFPRGCNHHRCQTVVLPSFLRAFWPCLSYSTCAAANHPQGCSCMQSVYTAIRVHMCKTVVVQSTVINPSAWSKQ
jgi:hypothetical protein